MTDETYYTFFNLDKKKHNTADTGITQAEFLTELAKWFPDWTYDSTTDTFTYQLYNCQTRTYITCTVPDEQIQKYSYSLRYMRND